MKFKNILNKAKPLSVYIFLIFLLFIAVVAGDKDEVITNFFHINWLTGAGLFLLGLKEMTSPLRLGWGLTRKSIHLAFTKRLLMMLAVFCFLWSFLLGLISLKENTSFFNLKRIKEIIWVLSCIFLLAQVGLCFGLLGLKTIIPLVSGAILFIGLYLLNKFSSFLGSSLIVIGGIIISIVNYRLIRNLKIIGSHFSLGGRG